MQLQSLAREAVFALARGTLSDEEIRARILAGETALFEVLMRRHNQRVYRAVRALIRDEAEAEDAMQQAYLSAYLNLAQFAGAAKLSTWLVRIAVNEALARLRRRARFVTLDAVLDSEEPTRALAPAPPTENPEAHAMSNELSAIVQRAIDALPEAYGVVFMLREVEGMDTAETAEALGLSADVIKTRLSRARAMLRERLLEAVGPSVREAYLFPVPRCDRMVARVLAAIQALPARNPSA